MLLKHTILRSPMLAALLFIVAVPAWADDDPEIQVNGKGEVAIAADMALLNLTVRREAPTASAALDANSKAMAEVLTAMRDGGVDKRDLQTSRFSIEPRYVYPKRNGENQAPKLVGYAVSNSLAVRVRDIEKVGGLLDTAVRLGVNEGGSIRFVNQDPSAALEQARVLAVKDAMKKAQTLAEVAGVKLGEVIHMSETDYSSYPQPMADAGYASVRMEKAVPVASGENSYSIQVNMVYAIDQ